jgi:hypothetical protein
MLLRRRIRADPRIGVFDDAALHAVCHLLDTLARGFAHPTPPTVDTAPAAVPGAGAVERAERRLAEQLHRADTAPRIHPAPRVCPAPEQQP